MLRRLEFHAMGCEMLAVLESSMLSQTVPVVTQWFEEWEQVLSRFRNNSELTRLNQTHDCPIQVSEVLWDVFQAALEAEQMTDGLVTPTVLHAMIDAGYDRPFEEIGSRSTSLNASIDGVDSPRMGVDANEVDRTITLHKGIGLDFGGIAKGWAAHQAMERLQVEGPALVDAAGDIAISGPRSDGGPWQIGIADPFHKGEEIEILFVNGCGVATSGKDRRRWHRDGALKHHIINPLTNQPAETDVLTVTVIAPNVMQAEAAAKAAFIQSSGPGLDWIEAHPEFAALFILDNGRTIYSEKMEEYL
jgi:FAD:protein FMN transferase